MAFKNLTSMTILNYQNLGAAFGVNPQLSTVDAPDIHVPISLKGWSGRNLAFKIDGVTGSTYTVDVDPGNAQTIRVNLDGNAQTGITYWIVDVWDDMNPQTNWSISFNTVSGGRSTGKWVFRKGMSDPNF